MAIERRNYLTVGMYKGIRKLFKGHGHKVECHHIIEKRLEHLNLKRSEYPSVALSNSLHKEITRRWKIVLPRNKKKYEHLSKRQMLRAVKRVYYDMPELRKIAIKTIKKHYTVRQ